jgi:hypothetical protein
MMVFGASASAYGAKCERLACSRFSEAPLTTVPTGTRARAAARFLRRLLAQMGGRRSGDVGQPADNAPQPAFPGARGPRRPPATVAGAGPTVAQQAA